MAPIACSRYVVAAACLEYLAQQSLPRILRNTKAGTDRDILLLTNRIVGGLHSLLIGFAAWRETSKDHWKQDDLIKTNSELGNVIIALELGFLLQDTLFLIQHRKAWSNRSSLRRILLHHLAYGFLSAWWLRAIEKKYSKGGAYFVISFLMMNLSNPPRYIMWCVRKYMQGSDIKQQLLTLTHLVSLLIYAWTRLGVPFRLIHVYGQRKGLSTYEAFSSLPFVCRSTTSVIALVSLSQLLQLSSRWPRSNG
ncbi:hypothetical protein BD324DRAFT_633866, partial [Kockovaella imperatae]